MTAEPVSDREGGWQSGPRLALAEPSLPERWPPAWPSLRARFLRRLAFVTMVDVLTAIGLLVIGQFGAQWWALAPALLLLTGPVLALARARRRLARAAAAGQLTVDADGLVGRGPGRP
jgi:hypothetical protein